MRDTLQKIATLSDQLTDDQWKLVTEQFRSRRFRPKEILVHQGEVATEMYFILKGCIRHYYLKEGADRTGYFFFEQDFAGAFESFTTQTPSHQTVEALEETEVLAITYRSLQKLYVDIPAMNQVMRLQLEQRYVVAQNHIASFILHSPEERYRHLIRTIPQITQRLAQHYIASYLGITPISLSRIRNRIAKKEVGRAFVNKG